MSMNWPAFFCIASGVGNMLPAVFEAFFSDRKGRLKSRWLTVAGVALMLVANACAAAFTDGWGSPEEFIIFLFLGLIVFIVINAVLAGICIRTRSRGVGIAFAAVGAVSMILSVITRPHPAVIAAAFICAAVRIVDFCLREG